MRRSTLYLMAFVVLLLAWQTGAWGQGADTPGEVAAGPEKKAMPETLLELIVAGGWLNIVFMSVLGVFSLIYGAIVLERLLNQRASRLVPPEFVKELEDLLHRREENPERLRDLCRRFASPIASILQAGLLRLGRPVSEIEKGMEDAVVREAEELRSKVRPLSVLANVAPMVGLLGTVVGMIMAFRTASQAGLGKAELLAEGIYLALETTVAGLVIAIPTMLFAAWFNSRIEKTMRVIDRHLAETIPWFVRVGSAGVKTPDPAEPVVSAMQT
jgi:biopolymer transport protein ExbB